MSSPHITIGLPTYGREQILLDTIKQLLAQDYKDFELIVADQTEQHKTLILDKIKSLSDKDTRLRYFRILPANLPAARNFIIEKARGKLVLFLDDDIEIKKDFVKHHIDEHTKHPEVTVVAGRVEQDNLPISDKVFFFDKYGMPQGTFNCPNSMTCQTFPGGNHSVKLSAIKKVGGYSTAYKKNAVREESNAAYNLHKAGYKMHYSAVATIHHLAAPYGGTRIFQYQFDNPRFYINDLLFALRTVEKKYLFLALFKRLRIYSGGSLVWPRLKRTVLFGVGFLGAVWHYFFSRKNFKAQEV